MKFKIEGKEIEVGAMRVGEVCEAEKALGIDMNAGTGARMATMLFVALRRAEPQKPISFLADEVMRADLATMEEVEEESPPAEPAAEGGTNGVAPTNQPISGPRPSVPSV